MVIYVFDKINNDICLSHCVHIKGHGKKKQHRYLEMVLPKDCMFYLNNKFDQSAFDKSWRKSTPQAQKISQRIVNSSKEISREQAFTATNDILYAIKLLKEG